MCAGLTPEPVDAERCRESRVQALNRKDVFGIFPREVQNGLNSEVLFLRDKLGSLCGVRETILLWNSYLCQEVYR